MPPQRPTTPGGAPSNAELMTQLQTNLQAQQDALAALVANIRNMPMAHDGGGWDGWSTRAASRGGRGWRVGA